jgi:peptide-methionine (R)-S-oxide reductase
MLLIGGYSNTYRGQKGNVKSGGGLLRNGYDVQGTFQRRCVMHFAFAIGVGFALCLVVFGCAGSAASGPGGGGGGGGGELSDAEWRKRLTPAQYEVLRQKGTERAFTGEYDGQFEKGTYACAACGQELFESETKFNSGCGWPAFYAAKAGDRVKLTPDYAHGMTRVEVTCARCGSHLGHVFNDAPDQPTGQRYCINSVSLKFVATGKGK